MNKKSRECWLHVLFIDVIPRFRPCLKTITASGTESHRSRDLDLPRDECPVAPRRTHDNVVEFTGGTGADESALANVTWTR